MKLNEGAHNKGGLPYSLVLIIHVLVKLDSCNLWILNWVGKYEACYAP